MEQSHAMCFVASQDSLSIIVSVNRQDSSNVCENVLWNMSGSRMTALRLLYVDTPKCSEYMTSIQMHKTCLDHD